MRRLRTRELDAWYAQVRRAGGASGGELSPNSVNRIHSVLRRALGQAVRWGWITTNPAAAASPPRVHREALEIPSSDEVGRLIAASAKVNWIAVAWLLRG